MTSRCAARSARPRSFRAGRSRTSFRRARSRRSCASSRINVGRTGTVTPVAILDPVEVSGTTVSRASLHNWDQVARLGLGAGDRVLLQKAGEIIPEILAITEKSSGPRFEAPTACPFCGAPLAREDGRVALLCTNRIGCPAQRLGAIEFFASRHQMNIDGLGEKVVAQLVDAHKIEDIADLFTLTAKDLQGLDRFAATSAANLVAAIEVAKQAATFSRLLSALGIPNVGSVLAKPIAAKYGTLSALRASAAAKDPAAFVEELSAIDGIGDTIAESVDRFLRDPHVAAVLDKLAARGVDPSEPIVASADGPLTGKTLVVTGTLTAPRADVQKRIEAAGGKVAGSVSKKTSYLVAGADTGKAKLEAAAKHGVAVIDEAELERADRGLALLEHRRDCRHDLARRDPRRVDDVIRARVHRLARPEQRAQLLERVRAAGHRPQVALRHDPAPVILGARAQPDGRAARAKQRVARGILDDRAAGREHERSGPRARSTAGWPCSSIARLAGSQQVREHLALHPPVVGLAVQLEQLRERQARGRFESRDRARRSARRFAARARRRPWTCPHRACRATRRACRQAHPPRPRATWTPHAERARDLGEPAQRDVAVAGLELREEALGRAAARRPAGAASRRACSRWRRTARPTCSSMHAI